MMQPKPLADFAERSRIVRGHLAPGIDQKIYDAVLSRVDDLSVARLQATYRAQLESFDPVSLYKYADIPYWIAFNIRIARRLELDRLRSLSILDIGAGAGFLLAIGQVLGHRTVGTDIEVPLYREVAEILGVDRRIAPVVRGEPHPDVGGPFDRVTLLSQTFDLIREFPDRRREYWSVSDWDFLLKDLAFDHCTPNASFYIDLNPQLQNGVEIFDAHLLAYCERLNGKVDRKQGIIEIRAARFRDDRRLVAPYFRWPWQYFTREVG